MIIDKHLKLIMYKSSYNINESAKIREITEADFSNDDEMPEDVIPLTNDETNDSTVDDNTSNNEPTPDATPEPTPSVITQDQQIEPPIENDKNVDELQNELIKLNLSSMNKMYEKLAELSNTVTDLNNSYEKLSSDVEEVREPSNEEKLINKKYDSHPYYKNLSDMWKGNWFQGRDDGYEDDVNEKDGIKKLDDETYVANYDDLPKVNNINGTF